MNPKQLLPGIMVALGVSLISPAFAAPVQLLVPGFVVRELPVDLNNINNLVYSPDGRLFALGYDGHVHQLHDKDGDGLEETVTPFHDNRNNEIPESIGMTWGPAATGSGPAKSGGLYIASRGKILFLQDKGDGTSELHVATEGWDPPTIKGGSSLDAVGIAVDSKGDIYFCLSVDAWSAPYRINKKTGQSDYHLYSERGTIMKLSKDWKRRDIICTGMRFAVSLAFNAHGDLFCSEQEGATWLANGNPFDELLHIQKGRHYGFPPRHPQHLPGVIDEPSVFDYRPQHQSTCGLHFNKPFGSRKGGFGPHFWSNDAFVAGESRGKIWRTKLVKSPVGYVAQNNLIACLSMLTLDAVPTPRGDMVVACHSGYPDWGTGPKGKGKLFHISYADTSAAQPVLAFATSPTETKIVFDRPLNLDQLRNLAKRIEVTGGEHVAAGDRFETKRPGYQVVKDQSKVGRIQLPVLSAGVTPDQQAILFHTKPRVEALNYAITLRDHSLPLKAPKNALPMSSDVDLLSDLNGVEAQGSVWLPHLDLKVSRVFTRASREYQQFYNQLDDAPSLTLRTQLDLHRMLRPAIQPGSTIDFEYAPERVTVVLKSTAHIQLQTKAEVRRISDHETHLIVEPQPNHWIPLELQLKRVGQGETPDLQVYWHTAEDSRPRAFPLHRFKLPWARPSTREPATPAERVIPEIAGGDWDVGKKLFFSDQLACGKCHQVNDDGGLIGPNLSNLIHRDYASVLKDITKPSVAINPDYIAQNVNLKNNESVSGVVVSDVGTTLILGLTTGEQTPIKKSDIQSRESSSVSLMPEGLFDNLSSAARRDLMTFLLKKRD